MIKRKFLLIIILLVATFFCINTNVQAFGDYKQDTSDSSSSSSSSSSSNNDEPDMLDWELPTIRQRGCSF